MKLSATEAKNSFKYSWLLARIFPYIRPYLFRIILGFLIAIPLGLLDGVTAFALKPYMDYVIGGKSLEFTMFGHECVITSLQMAYILPFAVVLFVPFKSGSQVLTYVCEIPQSLKPVLMSSIPPNFDIIILVEVLSES